MNIRIKQLTEQATTYLEPTPNSGEGWIFDKEKFAQLIIAHATECVRDVLRDKNSDLSYNAAGQVQDRIKQYFGVEE